MKESLLKHNQVVDELSTIRAKEIDMFGEFVHIKGRTEIEGKYYCPDCEEFFDQPYIVEYDESRGEFWGISCSEHMVEWHCPMCDSESIVESRDVILEEEE